ncbi:MAG: hypothetical protein AB7O96_01755 [Pseudobdellovibrionaceae bacterium]
MRPGREIDAKIAQEVFGYRVWARAKTLMENPPQGERPLRAYSKEMEWAWEIAEKLKITLLPIDGGQWFAFVGPIEKLGWESPQALLQFLGAGNFNDCGAAVGDHAPTVICEAALNAMEKRQKQDAPNLSIVEGEQESPTEENAAPGAQVH